MDPNISRPESVEKNEKEEQDEMIRNILAARLEPPARERLSRIALVSPERSKQIETILMQMARTQSKNITEEQLIGLLTGGKPREESKIVFHRKGLDDFDI